MLGRISPRGIKLKDAQERFHNGRWVRWLSQSQSWDGRILSQKRSGGSLNFNHLPLVYEFNALVHRGGHPMYIFDPGPPQNGVIRRIDVDHVKLNRKTKVPYAYLQSDLTMYNLLGTIIGHGSGVR